MAILRRRWNNASIFFAVLLLTLSTGAPLAHARQAHNRISQEVNEGLTVPLKGYVRPEVANAGSLSAAEQDLPMEHMILTLKADATQETALLQLLQDQQNPRSPSYRKFLTPQQFGERFGVSSADIAKVTNWLMNHGFAVEQVPAGHRSIVFSGTAAQVSSAFGTPIHRLNSGGAVHYANTQEPRIPAAFSGVVSGFVKLNDFHHKPAIQSKRKLARDETATPQLTSGSSHYLTPADYATIYNLGPLYASQINGTGQTIAIVARSNISMSDLERFRSQFGLIVNDPTVIIASGSDPGFVSGDGDEATLDVQWSGAVAPNARVKLVVANSTATADGVDLSAQYIVNNNIAPVMSVSFGSCEAGMGAGGVNFYNALWQQAAAQGITVLVSSGDSGAAGCNWGGNSSGSVRGVNGLCSSPYSICVGGTEFTEGSNPGQYWLPGNNAVMGSAQTYIPETVWNESGSNGGSALWAGGGGASIFFAKPSWQTGLGVPADGARDVPDLSLTAAGHDGYIIEEHGSMYSIAGTSASSPSLAGIMALLNQKTGARLGAPHANLYRLAALQNAGGAQISHDTKTGSNTVPGVTGYAAGTGYDQATGLGSVDAQVLVNHWSDTSASNSLSAVNTPSTLSLAAGTSSTFITSVSAGGSFNTSVALTASAPAGITVTLSAVTLTAPGSGSVTATVTTASTVAAGSYIVTITAAGGGAVATSIEALTIVAPSFALTSSAASVTVNSTSNATSQISITPSGGFKSSVSLVVYGLPAGVTATFSPATVNGAATSASTLTLSAGQTATAGTYAATIAATGGGVTKTVGISVTVVVPSFTITAAASTSTVKTGGSSSVSFSINRSGGFSSVVALTASGLPAGITASFSPATLSGSATGTSSLTLAAAQAAKAGPITVTVSAIGGGLTRSATLSLTVIAPSFTLNASGYGVTLSPGGSASVALSLAPSSGFAAQVVLTTTGLPTGVTASFSPSSVNVSTAATSTLTLRAGNTAKAGNYPVVVSANGGGITQTATMSLSIIVPSFTFTSSANPAAIPAGGNATAAFSVTPSGGFSGTVSFSAAGLPSGISVSFSPATLTISNTGTTTATFAASSATRPGTYNVTINASGGGVIRALPLTLTVSAASFNLTASVASLSVQQALSGQVVISTTATATFKSQLTLSVSGVPSGVQATFNSATIAPGSGNVITFRVGTGAALGSSNVTVTATGGGLTKSVTLRLTVLTQPAFTLAFSNQFIAVKAGGPSVPTTLSIASMAPWFNAPIALMVAGTQSNITQSFSTAHLTSAVPGSTLTVSANSSAKPGTYTIALAGYSGNVYQTVLLSVTVAH